VKRFRYLLGDSRGEAARLRAQGRLWDPVAHALFDRLGVKRGWRVLEVGPGQGSLHLDLRRRVGGPIDAVERSPVFASRLRRLCARDPGRIWAEPLLDADLPRGYYDLVFARWVFLFLPDPLAHVRKLAASLRPGGLLAVEDYYRETLGMIPRPPEWDDFLSADRSFFRSEGGDASIASRLPELYRQAGLEVTDVTPHIKTGRPGSREWKWMTSYFLGVMDRYAAFAPFTKAKAASLSRRWRAASGVLIAPAVVDVVGRKARSP